MKKIRAIDIIDLILMGFSIICMILSFSLHFPEYVNYLCFFVFGITLLWILMSKYTNKLKNQIDWQKSRIKLSNSLSYRIKVAGEKSFNEMPLGIIIFNNNDYHIEWANPAAKQIFHSDLIEKKFVNLNEELEQNIKVNDDFTLSINDREYHFEVIRSDSILFITDRNEYKELNEKYNNHIQAAGIINLDNYDQALSGLDAQKANEINGEIIGRIKSWSAIYDIFNRGYSDKQYLIIMNKEQLEKVKTDEFKIIDSINDYCNEINLKITVSIGICCSDKGIVDVMTKAEEMLNIALNRGGNQAVLFQDNQTTYYGGKVVGVNTYEPVNVRIHAEQLRDQILSSDKVLVMAHKDTDADAFASALALVKFARAYRKEAYMVFSEKNADDTVKDVYKEIESEHINMLDIFISPFKAINLMTKDTLLILSDVQYENLLCDKRVYEKVRDKVNKVAIIDHHRSNSSAISKSCYFYNKTTSSSSVELIIEMVDFMDENVLFDISPFEATLMLLGIIVDTSNLMYRTSSQTFIVLSKLQRFGADMALAKKYLREDYEKYAQMTQILNNIETYNDKYAIAVYREDKPTTRQFLAKIADNIMSVEKFKASFCIGRIPDNEIGISARSLGEENVQVIMEHLNGGGHFNNAATQLKDTTVEDAVQMLKSELDSINSGKGDDQVRIILIEDVKGKGKKNDVLDINNGYANYLIRNNKAIIASTDNINELKRQSEIEKKLAQDYLNEMKALKEIIDKGSITIPVKVGQEGKMFGTVSTKTIIEELKNQLNVEFNKKKMVLEIKEKEIAKLGTYKINVKLHKEVNATLTLIVVEKI